MPLLRQRQRVTYRALKLHFHLEDEALEALKEELLYAQPQVQEDAGRGLVSARCHGHTLRPLSIASATSVSGAVHKA